MGAARAAHAAHAGAAEDKSGTGAATEGRE